MNTKDLIPQSGLLEKIRDIITKLQKNENLEIIGSIFMTFNLECPIFEEAILPSIFGLEEAVSRPLRMHLLRSKIQQQALPIIFYDVESATQIGLSNERHVYIPVQISNCFQHAKHMFLLLAPQGSPEAKYLIFLTTSANLTQAGWYRNIEFADIEVIQANSSHSLQVGLIQIVKQLDIWLEQTKQEVASLRSLHRLKNFISTLSHSNGYPVLWTGEEHLEDFFARHVAGKKVKKLVLGAPYVSENAFPIQNLHRKLKPEQTQVLCPFENGSFTVSKSWFDKIISLPATLHHLYKLDKEKLERRLHAKFYFIELEDKVLVGIGSPNLSHEGMAKFPSARSHYETLILRETDRLWEVLEPQKIEKFPEESIHKPNEDELETNPKLHHSCRISLDWKERSAQIFRLGKSKKAIKNISLSLLENSSKTIQIKEFLEQPISFSPEDTETIFHWFETSPLLKMTYDGEAEGKLILIIEKNLLHAPSKQQLTLTVSDYLSYWKSHFLSNSKTIQHAIEQHFDKRDQQLQAEDNTINKIQYQPNLLNYSIAILNSFEGLRFRCRKSLEQEHFLELIALLVNENSLSLLCLLRKILKEPETIELSDADCLVVWLSATKLWQEIPEDVLQEFSSLQDEVNELLDELSKKWEHPDLIDLKSWMLEEWDWPKQSIKQENAHD